MAIDNDDVSGVSEEENIIPNPDSYWENDNKIVVDEDGKVRICKGCPCPVVTSVFYEDCDTGADIFVDPAILSFPYPGSISVGNVCFLLVGGSDVAIDTSVIQGESLDCDCDGDVWKRCSDDVVFLITGVGFIPYDFAWVIDSGAYVRAYKDGTAGPIDGAPCFFVELGSDPASCAVLCETDFNDTFDEPAIDPCQWVDNSIDTGTVVLAGGKAVFKTTTTINATSAQLNNRLPDFSGDFTATCDWTQISWATTGTAFSAINFAVVIGGTAFIVGRQHKDSGGAPLDRISADGCGGTVTQADTSLSGTFEIKRVGTLVTLKVNGILLDSCNNSGVVSDVQPYLSLGSGGTGTSQWECGAWTLIKSC